MSVKMPETYSYFMTWSFVLGSYGLCYIKDRGSLWPSGSEDEETFPVEEEHRRDWPHLVLSKVWRSILQLSSVHSSGQALTVGEAALGQLCPVVTTIQVVFFVVVAISSWRSWRVTVRIWESLSVMVSLNTLNTIFRRSLTGLRASTYVAYLYLFLVICSKLYLANIK